MSKNYANAEDFLAALRALPEEEQGKVLAAIVEDRNFRETLQDLDVFDQRRDEPSQSFEDYLSGRKK